MSEPLNDLSSLLGILYKWGEKCASLNIKRVLERAHAKIMRWTYLASIQWTYMVQFIINKFTFVHTCIH